MDAKTKAALQLTLSTLSDIIDEAARSELPEGAVRIAVEDMGSQVEDILALLRATPTLK